VISIFRIQSVKPLNVYLNKAFFSRETYRSKHLGYYGLIGLFFITCLSGINSKNIPEWIHFLQLKAPYILLPIVFCNHPALSTKVYHKLYVSLIIAMSFSCLLVLGYYFLDHSAITDSIGYGKSLWTPLSHVKFSVLLAISAIASLILSQRIKSKKIIFISIGVFLMLTIHILAVRSGLVVLYLVGGVLLIQHLWSRNHIKQIVLSICLLVIVPVVSYFTIPSVYQKVHYVKHDLKMIQEGQTANYSDGERMRSLQIGIDIIKKQPLFGTGIGDIRDVSNQYYADWFPDSHKKILPHNQYVLAFASCGILGLLLFIACLLSPLHGLNIDSHTLLFCLIFTLFIYGLVEKPLDEYVFVSVHALFVCAALSHNSKQNKSL